MSDKKKIALFELTTYHEECLYSQLKFLDDAGYEVTLILNPKNARNVDFYGISKKNIKYYDPRATSFFLKRFRNWFSLYQFITKNSFEKVLFNTASSNKETIGLLYFLPKHIERYGIIHNLKKLNDSTSQKIVSKRLKDYYVLNDFLLDSCEIDDKSIRLHSFYPIFFPKYTPGKTIEKNDDYWVCIPGELNYKRRDYDIVLKALSKLDNGQKLKIVILGKMSPSKPETKEFLEKIEHLKLEKYFITFSNFIENEIFHSYIKQSDFIMAPVSLSEQNYLKFKITGAYNLAFAYQKSLICPKGLEIISDLRMNSYFYKNENDLAKIFNDITNERLERLRLYQDEKWQYSVQLKKYIQPLLKSNYGKN